MSAIRISDFDTWRPGYGLATVRVVLPETTTLASLFSDEALTEALANPQTLIERVDDLGNSYGRFAQAVYVGTPFQLVINSVDRTGTVVPPLITLEEEDASLAHVIPSDGSEEIDLEDALARVIDVRNHGEWLAVGDTGASRATNTATLTAAIGVAGGRGGATVKVPSGTYQVANFTVPANVVVEGEARNATVLQSNQGGSVATLSGNDAGFRLLTLDGATQVAASVAVFAEDRDRIILEDVLIKRFETGVERDGGKQCHWRNFSISDCVNGYKAYATDDELSFNTWDGGTVELCSTVGVDFRYDGETCANNSIANVSFDTNTGIAVRNEGGRSIALYDCEWVNNTTNLTVLDESTDNQVIGLELNGGSMDAGAVSLTGRLENVALRKMRLTDITVTLTTPTFDVLQEDCEVDGVTISGSSTRWKSRDTGQNGQTFGVTTGSTATKAWAIALEPGEHVILTAKVIGKQRNAAGYAFYHKSVAARRPGASLAYDTQTGNFTKGNMLTGATSGATARIQDDSDSGLTGTLTLIDVFGVFVDNEIISDGAGGSATANGTQTFSNAALAGNVYNMHQETGTDTDTESDSTWQATFVANGSEIELQVTGASSKTIEWTCDVAVVRA